MFEQKNTETRYETKRKASGPWHKDWNFKPYRKWVLHVWNLSGPASGWDRQLQDYYEEQPVFAVLNGMVSGSWQPIHDFCEGHELPCLFPTTDLPAIDETDFYSVYFSKGVSLEADVLAEHFGKPASGRKILQIHRTGEPLGTTAAARLQKRLGETVTTLTLPEQATQVGAELAANAGDYAAVVAWLDAEELKSALPPAGEVVPGLPLYLSSAFIDRPAAIPDALRQADVQIVFTSALPAERRKLLMRSTGWLRAKRIHAPDEEAVQANA